MLHIAERVVNLLSSWNVQRASLAAFRMSSALTLLLLATHARAQLFDQFVPSGISGTDVEPDVTVTSRQKSGYDNGGIRVGSFVIRPRLTQSAGYESNVLGQTRATGSSVTETNAAVEARLENSYGSIVGAADVDDNRYLDLPKQSYTVWNARLGGTYNIGRDAATILLSHENMVQTQRDPDVPDLSAPLPVAVDRVRVGYSTNFNRLSLTPEVEVARFAYESGFADNIVYDQSFRNRVVVTPGVTAAYEFATRRRVVLVVRDTVASYSRGSIAQPKKNFNDALILGGIDYDLDGIVRSRLLVGYEQRTFSSTAYPIIQAPIAELTLIYNPTGLTTITGTLARRIQDSSSETTAGVTSLVGQLRIDHELRRNILLAASGSVTHNDYAGGSTQTLYTGDLSAIYLVNRFTAASATYNVVSRTGNTNNLNFNGLSAGSDFVDHRLMLQIRLAL